MAKQTGLLVIRGRALAAVVLMLTLAAGLVGGLPTPRAQAAPGDGLPVDVSIERMTPSVVRPSDSLKVAGTVVNTGTRALDRVDVDLRVRTSAELFRAGIVAEVEEGSAGPTFGSAVVRDLAPGASMAWTITVRANTLDLDNTGAYPLTVEASEDDEVIGSARTFLPWVAKGGLEGVKGVRVGMVWPVTDRPHRDGTTLGDDKQTPVFRDDELATSFAPGGRLYEIVAAGAGLDVDWVVDPELLDAAAAMTTGYRVAPPGSLDADAPKESRDREDGNPEPGKATPHEVGTTLEGTGGAAAAAWLELFKRSSGTRPLIALPYGDTDLAAVAHALTRGTDLRPRLSDARRDALAVVRRVLGERPVRTDVAWPASSAVDASIVELSRGSGDKLVLASGATLTPTKELDHTPGSRAVLPGTSGKGAALVTDPAVDAILAGDLRTPRGRSLATQQLLAELLTMALQRPQISLDLLITPSRTMDAATAEVLRAVTAASNAWTEGVSLANMSAGKGATTPRRFGAYPKNVRASEPSARYLSDTAALSDSTHAFASILTKPERVTGPFDPAVLGLLSTEWRGDPAGAERFRLGVTRSLRELESLVYIVRRTGVTLSGDSGNIPITVVNNLQQPINITLRATSHQPNRLTLGEPVKVTVPAGHMPVFKIPAKSAANGKVMIDVQVTSWTGQQVKPPESFFVNTTTIDALTRWIIGGLAFLLAVFSLRAFLRRRREAALAEAADDEDGEVPDDAPGDFDHSRPESSQRPQQQSDRSSPWPAQFPVAAHGGGNGPPNRVDPTGHTPTGPTTDRPE